VPTYAIDVNSGIGGLGEFGEIQHLNWTALKCTVHYSSAAITTITSPKRCALDGLFSSV